MNDLLEAAVVAHGGLDRWNEISSITVNASITGAVWPVKGVAEAIKEVRFEVDTRREHLTMEYVGQDRVSVFEPDRVVVQTGDGKDVRTRNDPQRSFQGHQFETPWDDLHLAYFTGAALWTYLNTPFLFTRPGFATDEITPIQMDGETWRRLEVTFPEDIRTHSRKQIFCFGPDSLLRRHDFNIDVIAGAPAELYAEDYRDVDGIVIPTKRRAYDLQSGGDPRSSPLMVAIDMGEISIR